MRLRRVQGTKGSSSVLPHGLPDSLHVRWRSGGVSLRQDAETSATAGWDRAYMDSLVEFLSPSHASHITLTWWTAVVLVGLESWEVSSTR